MQRCAGAPPRRQALCSRRVTGSCCGAGRRTRTSRRPCPPPPPARPCWRVCCCCSAPGCRAARRRPTRRLRRRRRPRRRRGLRAAGVRWQHVGVKRRPNSHPNEQKALVKSLAPWRARIQKRTEEAAAPAVAAPRRDPKVERQERQVGGQVPGRALPVPAVPVAAAAAASTLRATSASHARAVMHVCLLPDGCKRAR